jgi:hypothetical protein
MPKLPVISGRQARRAFEKVVLVKAGTPFNLTIPDHKELDRGLLRGLIRDAGITVEEFVELLS